MSLESTLENLLKRLDQATSRLETVEKALASGATSGSAPAAAAPAASGAAVTEFQSLLDQHITPLVTLSKKLDGTLAQQIDELVQALQAEKALIGVAANSKKPSQEALLGLLAPINNHAQKVESIRSSNRPSKFFNNLSAISESIGFLSWVVVEPTPGPHVAEMKASSEFYTNRILKEFKGVNQDQVDWVQHLNTFLVELQKYIKQYHTTGLTWNPRGGDAPKSVGAAAPAAPAPSAGGPPPPPPPPVFVPETDNKPKADMSAVFSSLAKGEGVTSGLKKVTNDMKSKNNPNKSSVVKADDLKPKTTTTATGSKPAVVKPPKFALESNKWAVEHQVGNKNIIIAETDPRQTVYVYQCTDSVIQVKGKVNAITLDGCKKTAIVFENAIASCEIVNCTSVEIQVTGKVPSVSIDKCSGAQIYLSKDSLATEIVTSKSSEMNVLIPGATENDDMVEIAIPEQFKTVVQGTRLVTESMSHI
ncbi:cyclase associated protein [Heterostelium album PN500]|uniref:Adenylyl cyclase-associated protein n=1 Tax=Heterostelium pallidum (strain ATCC 26659 / Pp 5 / PN500) TaxID=670386 RepID=D3B6D7_HETP5|nr:cyclase associated protein [Heterostelium album PN500]EFA82907.1 cyclase associated protein [Heterostelium album PN500]|eukprot:XP_020435024.1 cyclase associated protein [Heterostelium album PN500]